MSSRGETMHGINPLNPLDIVQAAAMGKHEMLTMLLSKGASVDAGVAGFTALHAAAIKGHPEVCEVLLSHGANVEVKGKGHTPLQFAAGEGHSKVCELLIDKGEANIEEAGPDGATALRMAARNGQARTAAVLLSKGARVDTRGKDGRTPFLAAAHNGHFDLCELLLANGSDLEERESDTLVTALHEAAVNGYDRLLQLLLSHKADVNPRSSIGYTPLHWASQEGQITSVVTLLQAGANPLLPDNEGALPIHLAADHNHVEVVRILIETGGSNPDQPDLKNGGTPLMSAALSASDETVSSLLHWGASPDKTNNDGDSALMYAIQSKCITTMNLLVPVTHVNLEGALYHLARERVDLSSVELQGLVETAAQDRKAAIKGFVTSARFGSSEMIKLLGQFNTDPGILLAGKPYLWMEAVKSDSEATVSALLPLLPNPPLEAISMARQRGVPGVVTLLLPSIQFDGVETREALKDAVLANSAHIFDQIPCDVEFTYKPKIDKLRPLLGGDTLVPYRTLLKQLHLPKVHFDDEEPTVCPSDCNQKVSCKRIQETVGIVHLITTKLGEKNKMFEGIEVSMIGSTKEGSRAFYNNEVDTHLTLSSDLKKFCFFDVKEQALKRRDPINDDMPEDVAKYFDDENIFRGEKYFYDFVSLVHSTISTLALPSEFSILPLKTAYTPCTRCMTLGKTGLQVMRCWHKTDCELHKMCKCEDPSKCECSNQCGCKEYASPSLTWSKVGLVLHLQWREEDGTLFSLDIDLNCPTWPTYTRFNGSVNPARGFLRDTVPVGWLDEYFKLVDMKEAGANPHLVNSKNWPVKFRMINRRTVISSQTLLFMNEKTLLGHKLEAYVLLKILKYCTGSPANSYHCKYAMDAVFRNTQIKSIEEMGTAIKNIINYKTIRGKFSGVHPDLAAEGISGVKVEEGGLHFISKETPGDSKSKPEQSLIFDFVDSEEDDPSAKDLNHGGDEAKKEVKDVIKEDGEEVHEEEMGVRIPGCCCF